MCEQKRCLMFCICAMIVLIFVSPALCCAPSRACLCCMLLSIAFIMRDCVSRLRAGFQPTFVRLLIHLLRIDVLPSCGLSFIHLCVRRLRADFRLHSGTSYSFICYPWDCACVRWFVCLSNRWNYVIDLYFIS
jgi:hypothetical protein